MHLTAAAHVRHTRPVSRSAFWLLACIATVVHWIPHFPPQIDLSQHAGQMRLLHDWFEDGFVYRDIMALNFFTPYLPAYVAGAVLTSVIPSVIAVKLLWTVGSFGTVFTAARLRLVLGGADEWDWLMLPGLFGIAFQWGFLTFIVALPIGLAIVELWVRHLRAPSHRKEVLIAAALFGLFFCHALVTAWVIAVCGLMAAGSVPRAAPTMWYLARRVSPLLTPLPVALIWIVRTRTDTQTHAATTWDWSSRYLDFLPQWLGIGDRWLTLLVGSTIVGILIVSGAKLARDPVRCAPLVVTMLILLAGPNRLYGNALTYNRFFALLGPAIVCALTRTDLPRRPSNRLRIALPLIVTTWVGFFGVRMTRFALEQQDFVRLVQVMRPHERTLSVVQEPGSTALDNRYSYLHFTVWYQAERGGLVEPSFAAYVPMIVRFRTAEDESVPFAFELKPEMAATRRLGNFHYVIVRTVDSRAPVLGNYPLTLTANEGRWWLYTRVSAGP